MGYDIRNAVFTENEGRDSNVDFKQSQDLQKDVFAPSGPGCECAWY